MGFIIIVSTASSAARVSLRDGVFQDMSVIVSTGISFLASPSPYFTPRRPAVNDYFGVEGPARHLAARCAPSGWSQPGSLTRFSAIPPTPRHLPLLISPGSLLRLRILPGGQGQQLDPPYHRPEESPRQVALSQEQPIVAGVLGQSATRLH